MDDVNANRNKVMLLAEAIGSSLKDIELANEAMDSACRTYASFVDEKGFAETQNYVKSAITKVKEIEPLAKTVKGKLEAYAEFLRTL